MIKGIIYMLYEYDMIGWWYCDMICYDSVYDMMIVCMIVWDDEMILW